MNRIDINDEYHLMQSPGGGVNLVGTLTGFQAAYLGGMEDLRKMARAILDELGEPLHAPAPPTRSAVHDLGLARYIIREGDVQALCDMDSLDDAITEASTGRNAVAVYELRAYVGPVERQIIR